MLMPLLTGLGHARHGEILREAAALADAGKLRPLINKRHFSANPAEIHAHALVGSRALGKVVIDL